MKGHCTIAADLLHIDRMGFTMLTVIKPNEKEIVSLKRNDSNNTSNVICFTSKSRTYEKSHKNVLTAARKLKW
jgi:hypothetical protein